MTDHDDIPPDSKLTRSKRRWAEEGKFLTGHAARPAEARLPPGQHLVRDWPVLDLGVTPNVPRERWVLDVDGAVEHRLHWDWATFQAQKQTNLVTDIHCVTTWSRYDNRWQGLPTRALLDIVQPREDAAFVVLASSDGYTTNLPLEDFAAPDAMIVHAWEGKPLTRDHGGPVRLIVPHLYLWKSAKWLKAITFKTADEPGFWETRGYHDRGDPWTEQRYSDD
jgi:DMSO/TMAO reductase YedYZ molybdopterin-dependent catalytic subunit